jgi:hypothetical protein
MNRTDDTVVLTGHVQGTHTRPDEPKPEELRTEVLTYNYRSGEWSMRSAGETRSHVTFTPKAKPAGVPGAAGSPGTIPKATGRSSRKKGGK